MKQNISLSWKKKKTNYSTISPIAGPGMYDVENTFKKVRKNPTATKIGTDVRDTFKIRDFNP